MGKLAFVFPGQGAQYVGMGKEFQFASFLDCFCFTNRFLYPGRCIQLRQK